MRKKIQAEKNIDSKRIVFTSGKLSEDTAKQFSIGDFVEILHEQENPKKYVFVLDTKRQNR